MKRFLSWIIFIFIILTFSCGNVSSDSTYEGINESEENWSGETVKKTYSSTNYIFEVTNTMRNLDITLPNGKYDVYAVQINNSDYTVAATQNQYIVEAGFLRSARSANDVAGGFIPAGDLLNGAAFPDVEIPEDDGHVKRVHFVDNFVPPPSYENKPSLRSASPSYIEPPSPSYVEPTLGTIKDIYVDIKNPYSPGDISLFQKKAAKLQAVGEHCYVWVVNSYLGEEFNQINSLAATKIKDEFDGFYEYVRYVFGKESDNLITRNGTVPMPNKKVNIVIYDILEDATPYQSGGVLGYFYSKDYYSYSDISNGGKYFYIDSYFAKRYWAETISTLAHEFQHMINFNVKNLQQGVDGYSGYNEMLSMLCEDMLQTKMKLSDLDSPKYRFLNFLSSYYKYGIFDEPIDASFYSVTYMFGAFLARNYGGAKLVQQMAQNGYKNAESITEALRALGYSETFEDVFKEYAKTLVLDNQAKTDKTFNKDAKTYDDFQFEGYKFPMTKFNIFEFKDRNGISYSMSNVLHNNNIRTKYSRKNLHGKGIIPYYVGYTEHGGDLRLTFSSPVNSNSKFYILVQECNHNHN